MQTLHVPRSRTLRTILYEPVLVVVIDEAVVDYPHGHQ